MKIKAVVDHMPGDRVDGYYYIKLCIGQSVFILARGDHPDFLYRECSKVKAQGKTRAINKLLLGERK